MRSLGIVYILLVFSACFVPAIAQTTCTASAVPVTVRTAGDTELVSDIVLACTGGTVTPAGSPVPQINLTVFLNTDQTSLVTEHNPAQLDFSEALLLIDEPNRGIIGATPPTPLLNCGNTGAPDNGPLGPGVCEIISDGNPADTYDGTPFVPVASCGAVAPVANYGCGRPNAFQGRASASASNVIEFLGVPFDPPAPGGTRILRITNIRANAEILGGGGPHGILVDIAENGSTAFSITPNTLTVADSLDGLVASAAAGGVLHLEEGFANAWLYRNVNFALANATPGTVPYPYIVGDTNYPVDAAQNVPGIVYNTEEGFQWQNNGANAPPSPDPPPGYGSIGTSTNFPLLSVGYGGINTGISGDGVASSGTRIALAIGALGETVTLPNVIFLHPVGSPGTTSGVMVHTVADSNGAGAFSAVPGATFTFKNLATVVYEVLYSDPFVIETADVPLTITGGLHEALVLPLLAPFYIGPDARFDTPTTAHPLPTAIPRFAIVDPQVVLVK